MDTVIHSIEFPPLRHMVDSTESEQTMYSRCLVGLQLQPESSLAADTLRDFVLDTLKSTYGVPTELST